MTTAAMPTDIHLLNDGRLANLSDWNEDIAQQLASQDGLKLEDDHWQVINTMRDYYSEYGVSPVKKLLKRSLKQRSQSEKFNDDFMNTLFPNGVLTQGSKIAGIPVPYLDVELERSTYGSKAAKPGTSHFTDSFEFEGQQFEVSHTGNLVDLHLWNDRLAEFMARKEGIELTAEHWEILHFLRKFYFEYGVSPMVKILQKHMREELGDEVASREHLYGLFPQGPSRQGSRIAGLPEPQGCIDG
jgi:TusE/DsrC/DsvC family sulfur relay protein